MSAHPSGRAGGVAVLTARRLADRATATAGADIVAGRVLQVALTFAGGETITIIAIHNAHLTATELRLAARALQGARAEAAADPTGRSMSVAIGDFNFPAAGATIIRIGHDGARALDVPTGALTAIRRGAVEIDVVANAWIGC